MLVRRSEQQALAMTDHSSFKPTTRLCVSSIFDLCRMEDTAQENLDLQFVGVRHHPQFTLSSLMVGVSDAWTMKRRTG